MNGIVMNSETTRNLGGVFFILLIFYVFINKNIINYKLIPFFYIASFSPVVLLPLMIKVFKAIIGIYSQNSIRDVLTFSGRVYIWDKALILFEDNPLFGYGLYRAGNERIHIWGINEYCHNEIMEILIDGGIILLILVLFLIIVSVKKMSLRKENPVCSVITIAFIVYSVDCLFEAPIFIYTQVFFMLITVAYHIEKYTYDS